MIVMRYLRYYPEKIFELSTGLSIYESKSINIDGTRGIVGGPHHVFTEIEETLSWFSATTENISIPTIQPIQNGISSKPRHFPSDHLKDVMLNDESEYESNTNYFSWKQQDIFNQVENAATEISYRCISCRDYKDCLNNEHIENIEQKSNKI